MPTARRRIHRPRRPTKQAFWSFVGWLQIRRARHQSATEARRIITIDTAVAVGRIQAINEFCRVPAPDGAGTTGPAAVAVANPEPEMREAECYCAKCRVRRSLAAGTLVQLRGPLRRC